MEKKIIQIIKKQPLPVVFTALLLLVGFQSCRYNSTSDFSPSSGEGAGGSMARFTIANNHLFTVDQSTLKIFDISTPETPNFKSTRYIGFGVETIFPFDNKLFLGASTGMYIYDVSNPVQPEKISFYEHIVSCDPVVSDGNYAYVTLNSSNQVCWQSTNELQIISLQNIQNPELTGQYPMEGPRGLAIQNDTLWVCDNGIKIYDVSNRQDIVQLYHFDDIEAYDVILNNGLALVIGERGFVQYKLENDTIKKLSEINLEF